VLFFGKPPASLITNLTKTVVVLSSLVFGLAIAFGESLSIPTFHVDGAFQTASGMFRLSDGQLPGRDFLPYLGIGPMFLLFPVFILAGGTLAATVLSSYFSTYLLFWLTLSFLWKVLSPKPQASAVTAGAALALFVSAIYQFSITDIGILSFFLGPGNSLRPVRSIIPVVVSLFLYLIARSNLKPFKKAVLFGLSTGLAAIWSNDFSVVTMGLSVGFVAIIIFSDNMQLKWQRFTVFISFATLSGLSLLLVFTGGNPITHFEYNFRDVRGDQWWYFGPYFNRYLSDDWILRLFREVGYLPFFILVLLLLASISEFRKNLRFAAFIGLALFGGGLVASLGGHLSGGYFSAFRYWAFAVITIILIQTVIQLISRLDFSIKSGNLPFFSFLALVSILVTAMQWDVLQRTNETVAKDDQLFFSSQLGGYLPIEWRGYIDLATRDEDLSVVEEYWGIWSSINKQPSLWRVDSVIHALGKERQVSKASLPSAERIITTKSLFSGWQPWSLGQNYWFYKELFLNWKPIHEGPNTIVWGKLTESRNFTPITCEVIDVGTTEKITDFRLEVSEGESGFYSVQLKFAEALNTRDLVMAQTNIRTPVSNGFVSIDPKEQLVEFPVYLDEDLGSNFTYHLIPGDGERPLIESCSSSKIPFYSADVLFASTERDFFVSDSDWKKGVSLVFPGFYVRNTAENRVKFSEGNLVNFRNGESRVILESKKVHTWIWVYLEGSLLDADEVGYPNKFQVDRQNSNIR